MIEAALEGLYQALTPNSLALMCLGVLLGSIVGFLPGIGGPSTLAIMLPFVMTMKDPYALIALLVGFHAVLQGGGKTVIGNNNYFMAYSHVAHDCKIGNEVVMANGATLAGHILIEDFAIIGGLSAIHQFCRVGAYAIIGGITGVILDIPPYTKAQGDRAKALRTQHRWPQKGELFRGDPQGPEKGLSHYFPLRPDIGESDETGEGGGNLSNARSSTFPPISKVRRGGSLVK